MNKKYKKKRVSIFLVTSSIIFIFFLLLFNKSINEYVLIDVNEKTIISEESNNKFILHTNLDENMKLFVELESDYLEIRIYKHSFLNRWNNIINQSITINKDFNWGELLIDKNNNKTLILGYKKNGSNISDVRINNKLVDNILEIDDISIWYDVINSDNINISK